MHNMPVSIVCAIQDVATPHDEEVPTLQSIQEQLQELKLLVKRKLDAAD